MPKPNFFIIWEPKCWTTILHNYLSNHKDIFMSKTKEPHYFNTDHHQEAIQLNWEGKTKNSIFRYINKEDYLSLFEQANKEQKIIWESSTNYAYSKLAAKEIYNFNHNPKLLFCIREPLSFLQSWHSQIYKTWSEFIENFEEALISEKDRKKWKKIWKRTKYSSLLYYSEWIKFTEHLQRYLDYFPKEQIKVVIYEEFKKDNQKTIDEITDFLWVDRMKIDYKQANITPKTKLTKFLKSKNIFRRFFWKILPLSFRKKWWIFVDYIDSKIDKKTNTLSLDAKTKLMKQFKPEVEKINDLLHKHNLIDPEIDLVKYWWYDKV